MDRKSMRSVLPSLVGLFGGRRSPPRSRAMGHYRRLSRERLEPRQMLALDFDFGRDPAASAVDPVNSADSLDPGSIGVFATPYAAGLTAQGVRYGWTAGTIYGADRGPAFSDRERDVNFTADGTFRVDVPNGTYRADIVVGDMGAFDHEGIEVIVEGQPLDVVSTLGGQNSTHTFTVQILDGHFQIRIHDLGGTDPNAAIQSLTLTAVPADATGPTVVVSRPAEDASSLSTTASPVNFTVVFSEPVFGFTDADVTLTPGTTGATTSTVTGQGTTYHVAVSGMTADGTLEIQVGAGVAQDFSANGNLASNTASAGFQFVGAGIQRFDFGTASSPLEAGWTRITETSPQWLDGVATVQCGDRITGQTDHQVCGRDFNCVGPGAGGRNFAVPLDAGAYQVEIVLGDLGPYAHDNMQVSIDYADLVGGAAEIVKLDLVSTDPSELAVLNFRINKTVAGVTPVRFTIEDLGGIDPNAVIQSLVVTPLGAPDAIPLQATITHAVSQGNQTGLGGMAGDSVADFTIKFNKPVRNFTAGDFVATWQPLAGAPVPQAVTAVTGAGTTWNAQVAGPAPGAYGAVLLQFDLIAPALTDLSGNLLAVFPVFAGVVWNPLLAPLALYDFGTPASSVQPRAIQVTEASAFAAGAFATGGWVTSPAGSVERLEGARTLLDRDVVFGPQLQFRTSNPIAGFPVGDYFVDLVLGDLGNYAHDEVEISLNGVISDLVSTEACELKRLSYFVHIDNVIAGNNTLTVDLIDRGGSDANVAIAALEIRTA